MKLNMDDIAQLSGVSRQTVSAVINNKSWVSQETRERVRQVIAQHQYVPNLHASSLTGKATRLIGIILRDITNPFYARLALGIETVLNEHGYAILYVNTREEHQREVEGIANLLSYNIDGIIIAPILVGVDLSHLWRLHQRGNPMVSIDNVPGMPCSYVDFDNFASAHKATSYLIEMGHKQIGFLGGPETATSARERFEGFRQCLFENQLPLNPEIIIEAGTTSAERNEAAYRMLHSNARPTAVLCFNDLTAIDLYQAARNIGLEIGKQLSVVGFDDIEASRLISPTLTTVQLQAYEAGQQAAQLLLKQIEQANKGEAAAPPENFIFHPQLIIRESVGKCVQCKTPRAAASGRG